MKKFFLAQLLVFFVFGAPLNAFAQAAPSPEPSSGNASITSADPAIATRAWLDSVPPDKKARSDAYFEGGYWLILWNFLLNSAIALLFLASGYSARLRDFAERTTRFKALQVLLFGIPFILISAALSSPLDIYQQFFREHAYGMAAQTFGPWFREQLISLAVSTVGVGLLLIALYAVFRRAPRTWWLWGTGVVVVFGFLTSLIFPIYVAPLFNKYNPLTDATISEAILVLARANQIPVKQVFEVDASRQTKRVSANVAGVLGTMRIALNDNLLRQCSLPEIRHVMAHEMGHYVLNHSTKLLMGLALSALITAALARAAFDASVRRWGKRWKISGISDLAGLPLLTLIFGVLGFLATPLSNTRIRIAEVEADAFGLNAAREPDAMAKVSLKLGEYRKLDPSPLEEFVFFDHPSGRARIRMAMDWKAAHPPAGGAILTPDVVSTAPRTP